MLDFTPAVFAVGKNYDIVVYTSAPSLISVKVGDEIYYDDSNGILRSGKPVHKITVPMRALDSAGEYTVYQKQIIERKPYFTETEAEGIHTYAFRPLPQNPRCYHISDAHNLTAEPIAAARAFGDIDMLIMNGDIPDHCGDLENCKSIYLIADGITKGEIPIIFSRGNHDMRGIYAEEFANYTPNDRGKTYFTVTLGNLWAIILDCGEDKDDGHPEYGNTVCCHDFRLRQTKFIQSITKNANEEYASPLVKHKLVISHKPFSFVQGAPFDIEKDIYSSWCKYIKDDICPDLFLSGHLHTPAICYPGGELDDLGLSAPLVIASGRNRNGAPPFTGAGIEFTDDGIFVTFTDCLGCVGERTKI